MIPLDPGEILGAGCADTLRRVLTALSCLVLGAFAAGFGIAIDIAFETVLYFLLYGPTFGGWTVSIGDILFFIFLIPFYGFASFSALFAIPNALIAFVYFAKTEEPTLRRFLTHTGIHQIATTASLFLWHDYFPDLSDASFWEFLLFFVGIIGQLVAFGALIFIGILAKNRIRIRHEQHLMTVAAENSVKKEALKEKVHIPPPPAGIQGPKARALTKKEDES